MDFLAASRGWMARHADAADAAVAGAPGAAAGRLATLPLWGREERLAWVPGSPCRLARMGEGLGFVHPPGADERTLAAALRDFLEAEGRSRLGRRLPGLLPGIDPPPRGFRLRPLASVWGCLNPSGWISLDLALVLADPVCFDYVLVHELCHLRVPNHSAAFWHEVEQRFPDWHQARRRLAREGLALKRRLAQWLGGVAPRKRARTAATGPD